MSDLNELAKESLDLNTVLQELAVFNITLQTAGDKFALERGGVAIPYVMSQPGAGKTASFGGLCKFI